MASPETILAQAAADGSIDPANLQVWPQTLQYILDRLEEIYNDFPKPVSAPPDPLSPSPVANANWATFSISRTNSNQGANPSSQDSHASQATDKENARPATPPLQAAPTSAAALTTPPPSDPHGIPADVVAQYRYIRKTLTNGFSKEPPHTIQRLAELILEPKRHYRFLPSYLQALDRVVSVTSPSTVFPLPLAVLPGGLLNGNPPTPPTTLGSDESLGGALLTPIPWLQNRSQSELISESTEMVQGPNGAGRIETVSVMNGQLTSTPPQQQPTQAQILSPHPDGETLPSTGPVTQGELLRQEQEAGVLLSNPHSIHPNRSLVGETDRGDVIIQTVEDEGEVPHARGPEMIGMEDTGPQRPTGGTLDIEGAVGRPSIERSSRSPNPPSASEGGAETEIEKEAEAEAESKKETQEDQTMSDEDNKQQQPEDGKSDEEMKEDD